MCVRVCACLCVCSCGWRRCPLCATAVRLCSSILQECAASESHLAFALNPDIQPTTPPPPPLPRLFFFLYRSRRAKVQSRGDAVEQIASWHRSASPLAASRAKFWRESMLQPDASTLRSIASLSTCDVAVLMLDGNEPVSGACCEPSTAQSLAVAHWEIAPQGVVRQQDLALMQVAIDKGKPVMFAVNKTDCIPAAERGPVLKQLLKQLHDAISQVRTRRLQTRWLPYVAAVGGHYHRQPVRFGKQVQLAHAAQTIAWPLKHKTIKTILFFRGIDRVLDAAANLHAKACSKQSTQQLNAWLEDWRRAHPPTPGRGTRLK